MGRLAQIQIIVAAMAALAMFILKSGSLGPINGGLPESLEGLSFVLCAVAVSTSGRQLRGNYERLGSDSRVARQSPDFMRTRQSVRRWSYVAALIMASLAAARFNVSVIMVLVVLGLAVPVLTIVVDRASGWRGDAGA